MTFVDWLSNVNSAEASAALAVVESLAAAENPEDCLRFPRSVATEARQLYPEELVVSAFTALANGSGFGDRPFGETREILGLCPEVIDADDESVGSHLTVLTFARYFHGTVVSDETHPLPGRLCVHEAGHQLGIEVISVEDFQSRFTP